jgi:hypothetical protein
MSVNGMQNNIAVRWVDDAGSAEQFVGRRFAARNDGAGSAPALASELPVELGAGAEGIGGADGVTVLSREDHLNAICIGE